MARPWALEVWMVGLGRIEFSTKNCLVRQTCLSFQFRALSPAYGLGVHCLASPTTFQPFEFSMTLLNRFAVPYTRFCFSLIGCVLFQECPSPNSLGNSYFSLCLEVISSGKLWLTSFLCPLFVYMFHSFKPIGMFIYVRTYHIRLYASWVQRLCLVYIISGFHERLASCKIHVWWLKKLKSKWIQVSRLSTQSISKRSAHWGSNHRREEGWFTKQLLSLWCARHHALMKSPWHRGHFSLMEENSVYYRRRQMIR